MDQQNQEQPFMTNREMISDMHVKITNVHRLMYGDKEADVPGIAHRVKTLETADRKRAGIYMMISALASGIAIGIKSMIEHFK